MNTNSLLDIYCLHHYVRKPLFFLLLFTLTFFLIFAHHYYITDYGRELILIRRNTSGVEYEHNSRIFVDRFSKDKYQDYLGANQKDLNNIRDDLIIRIEDLKRIKLSIRNELGHIEREKAKLLKEKASLIGKNERLLTQISRSKAQLRQLDLDISSNKKQKLKQICDTGGISPIIFNPLKSSDIEKYYITTNFSHNEDNHSIFNNPIYTYNFIHCPLSREFKFYLLEPVPKEQVSVLTKVKKLKIDPSVVRDILKSHNQYTRNISEACLVIGLIQEFDEYIELDANRNNLLINLIESSAREMKFHEHSAIASSTFLRESYRDKFDIVLPSIWQSPASFSTVLGSIGPQSPIDRKYLASYFGQGVSSNSNNNSSEAYELNTLEETLQIIHKNSIDDLFLFIYNCGQHTNVQCYEEKEKIIELSTFMILLIANNIGDYSNNLLYLALSKGAIPVIIGKEKVQLPFDEVIDWRKATIMLHTARLPEVHFILRSINPSDIYQLKYHGRRIFENYLATARQIIDSTISLISQQRFGYPPPPVKNIQTITHYPSNYLKTDVNCTSNECIESKSDSLTALLANEILGPREKPFQSPSYQRNYSLTLNFAYDLWNNPSLSPLQLYPSHPTDPTSPSEYKFYFTNNGFRPIGDGLGGSGNEFSRAIGGDYPNEQFTIIMLTYERKTLLIKTLERLKGLPYLNKIIVVWNGIKHNPPADMLWPDVGVPIVVVKVNKNSLNNRFLPFDAIETDAILSLDDDSPLRPDEIVFAFRVWRESRERIVGFPGRYHAWDSAQNSWSYNSNHSCELSMVLTGGAFFHRYYSYMYTYSMPEVIHSIVDKFMNCEDIAMNFLVAHLTRKPPIKVTSRWTFHCAGCTSSLSEDDSHFRERHECLNTFTSIYGYMPLMSTQHRSDSVLFKTRLPHDKQKCFKFV